MLEISLFHDGKLVIAALAVAASGAVTLVENCKKLFGYRSVAAEAKDAQAHITETIEFMSRLQAQNTQSSRAALEKLEADLNSTLKRLAELSEKGCRLREDPNHDLTFVQRLLLLFEPEGRTAHVFRWLAYLFMLAAAISIFFWIHVATYAVASQKAAHEAIADYLADAVILACYGALVFRAWSLAERRWRLGYVPRPGVFGNLVVLRKPVNRHMAIAQVCFWACLYWVFEGIEDFLSDVSDYAAGGNPPSVVEALFKFLPPLVVSILCWLWVAAEWQSDANSLGPRRWLAIFSRTDLALPMIACVAGFALSIQILVTPVFYFQEQFHEWAFSFQALVACIACFHWLRLTRLAQCERAPAPASAHAAAA